MELIAERGKSFEDTAGADLRPAAGARTTAGSRKALRTGRVMSAVAILFLAFDGAIKVLQLAPAVDGTIQLGYPASIVFGLGILELACLAAYATPRTSVLGAILLTGYLGGAVATHARLGHPLFTHVFFPIYVAILVWGGLSLRNERLRAVLLGGRD